MVHLKLSIATQVLTATLLVLAPQAQSLEAGANVHVPVWNFRGGDPSNGPDEAPGLDSMKKMGMSWARMDMGWSDVEKTPMEDLFAPENLKNWVPFDASILALRQRGIKTLAILGSPPDWATTTGDFRGPLKDDIARQHWRRFVPAVVQRYGHDVAAFEIVNEPNLEGSYLGSVSTLVHDYVIPAREEIKSRMPGIKVVGPALAGNRGARIPYPQFFAQLGAENTQYQNATGESLYDAITQHLYPKNPKEMEQWLFTGHKKCFLFICWNKMPAMVSTIENAGFKTQEIWLTEIGWNTVRVSEKDQASFLAESYQKLARQSRISQFYVYEIRDDLNFPAWGILRADNTEKPAVEALRQAIHGYQLTPDLTPPNTP